MSREHKHEECDACIMRDDLINDVYMSLVNGRTQRALKLIVEYIMGDDFIEHEVSAESKPQDCSREIRESFERRD